VREEIWSTLRLVTASGIAAVIVDKNLDDLLALADRHVVMAKGEILFDGTGEMLRADEALIHRYLGV
jgi:branched-chain amino acid transport system ATP-binding protein